MVARPDGRGNFNYYIEGGSPGIDTGSFYWHRGNISRLMALTYEGRLGIGVTLPDHTFHVVGTSTVTSNSFFISTTKSGTAVTFTSLGEGNSHEFNMAKSNEKSLFIIDDVAQYPLIRTDVTHTLDGNLSSEVGVTTNIIHLSGISTLSSSDILKIDDEFVDTLNIQDKESPEFSLVDEGGLGKTTHLGKSDAMYVSVINQLIAKIETLEAKVAALESA